jgi:hypothetical protein
MTVGVRNTNVLTFTLPILLCLLCPFSRGQEDMTKQKAIDQMRKVANAMKHCPEQMRHFQDQCQIHQLYSGPPSNLEWDVIPSKTVRSPYQGVIEFTLPSRSEDVDTPNQSAKFHQQCVDSEARLAVMAAPAAVKDAEREGHFRYEFDLGNDSPELVKMLWVSKDKDNNVVSSTASGNECWVRAAQSIGN